jgi:hypothetical protein
MTTLTLCALFLTALQADRPKVDPPAGGVDAVIAAALRNHPDVRVAEAKLRLAQVELEQAKSQLVAGVAVTEQKVRAAKQGLDAAKLNLDRTRRLLQNAGGLATQRDLEIAEQGVLRAEGEVLAAEQARDAAKNSPGLKVAEAKAVLAAAEVEQVRLQVTKGVSLAYTAVRNAQAAVEETTAVHKSVTGQIDRGAMSQLEGIRYGTELRNAKAALATAEAEWQAATGGGAKAEEVFKPAEEKDNFLKYVHRKAEPIPAPTGSAADKLRALLDKPIKLDLKAAPFSDLMPEFLKQTGLDAVTVRYPTWASIKILKEPPTVGPLTGEKTLTAWVELLMDEFQNPGRPVVLPGGAGIDPGPYVVVVREYGLLIVGKKSAPPDALTLTEFAKLVRAEREKGEPKK